VWSCQEERVERPVVFLLPGVGEPYAAVAGELYQQEETFSRWVDRCSQLLKPVLSYDLRERMLSVPQTAQVKEEVERRKQTSVVQPATFVLEYALAQLLIQWGIRPQALLGYSLGEYVAACLAGVFSLEDALLLVARRAQLIQEMAAGAMLAVALSKQEIQPYLNEQVSLAAINAPRTCVLTGSRAAIAAVEEQLSVREIVSRRVEAEQQRAGALRAAELVRRQREAVGAPERDRQPGGLHRIDMQKRAVAAAERGGLGDRLEDAGLVVGGHEADQRGRRTGQQGVERRKVGDSVRVHREGPGAGGEQRRMLDSADDQCAAGAESVRRRLSNIFQRPMAGIRPLPRSNIHGSNCQSPRAQRCWRAAATS